MVLVNKKCVDASKDGTVHWTLTAKVVRYVKQESTQIMWEWSIVFLASLEKLRQLELLNATLAQRESMLGKA